MTAQRAALAALAMLALAPAPAATAGVEALRIARVDTSAFPTVAVTVEAPGASAAPDLRVAEAGQPVPDVDLQDAGPPAVAIVIDTSRSMAGRPLDEAVAAARAFVAALPAGSRIAVIGFGAAPYEAAPLVADPVGAGAALDALAADGPPGTAIHGAVELAAHLLAGAEGASRSIVVLSDGASRDDTATAAAATAAADAARATVHGIAFVTHGEAPPELAGLAGATGGRAALAREAAALDAVYRDIARTIDGRYTFTYRSHVGHGEAIRLDVAAAGFQPAVGAATAPGERAAAAQPAGSSRSGAVPALLAAFAAGAAALLVMRRRRPAADRRIAPFIRPRAREGVADAAAPAGSLVETLLAATERAAGGMNVWRNARDRLEQADVPLRTAELFYIQLGAGLALTLTARLLLGLGSFAALAAALVGFTLPGLVIRLKARRRRAAFEAQLPETLIAIAASLKAGHGFNQALQTIVKEGEDPAAKEFGRVLTEIQLGMAPEAALEAMTRRMGSANFGFVVIAVSIQRTVGGSLAEILDTVGDTVRQRQQFSRKVKALTAQGRASAYVLAAMPFVMAGLISMMNRDYMAPLFTTTLGKMMMAAGVVMIGIGAAICRRIVSFRV
jgi:tight adherence protein B